MRTVYFNFNNEVDRFAVNLDEETGKVTIPGPEGQPPLAQYDSMQQFAEMYAQARDVKPEHLKNWQLVEQGDVVSFILRAGTAGVALADVNEAVAGVLDELAQEGRFHPIDIQRFRQEISGMDNGADAVGAISSCTDAEIAREVYDRLDAQGAFAELEPEPMDERSEVEKYLDSVMEKDGTLAFFSNMLDNGNVNCTKEEVLAKIEESTIPYTADVLRSLYESALENAMMDGINVGTRFKALLICTQNVAGTVTAETKNRIIASANFAGRESINLLSYEVGRRHIRSEAKLFTPMELDTLAIAMDGNTPVAITFDGGVDEQVEAEEQEKERQREITAAAMRSMDDEVFDEDEDYDDEDDDYDF